MPSPASRNPDARADELDALFGALRTHDLDAWRTARIGARAQRRFAAQFSRPAGAALVARRPRAAFVLWAARAYRRALEPAWVLAFSAACLVWAFGNAAVLLTP